jgi:RNA polymerase sigma-70 factor, ECF subfamily
VISWILQKITTFPSIINNDYPAPITYIPVIFYFTSFHQYLCDLLQISYMQLILVAIISRTRFLTWKMESKITETQLLEKVKESNVEAFRLLFERYQPVVFRQVLFQTRRTDLAHDIVQETFIKVWKHRGSLKPHLSFLAYILRISGNLARDYVKHRNIRKRLEDSVPSPALSEGDDPGEALQLYLLQERINVIINEDIPKRCREVFLLSRFEGKTNKEIADIFQVSVRTIEHQIVHALKVLRKKLSDYL